MHLVID